MLGTWKVNRKGCQNGFGGGKDRKGCSLDLYGYSLNFLIFFHVSALWPKLGAISAAKNRRFLVRMQVSYILVFFPVRGGFSIQTTFFARYFASKQNQRNRSLQISYSGMYFEWKLITEILILH